ncbi:MULTISPECIES: hypothetical protein [Clostridium]|uniref:hypothetical protein n=1 Tax=Clostridium TaxID=1485 RepID=UPI0015D477FF|nr:MULTISPECIES: hypothetical protein [Clostridium]
MKCVVIWLIMKLKLTLNNDMFLTNSFNLRNICDGIDQVVDNYVEKTTEAVNNFSFE